MAVQFRGAGAIDYDSKSSKNHLIDKLLSLNSDDMASSSITSPSKTAFLTLDLQPCIFALAAVPDYVLANAVKSVEFARRKGTQVIHIGIAFSEGYPELDGIVEGGGKEAKAREGRNEWQLW